MNTELKEKIYEQLFDCFNDNTDELFDVARGLNFDWAMTYEGAEEVYEDYFCGDIVDTINAFVDARLEADNYTEYCFDDFGSLCEVDDFDVDEHIYKVAERLIVKCENGIPASLSCVLSSEVCEILEQKAVSFEDLLDSCRRHFAGACVRHNHESENVADFLNTCRHVVATELVVLYLEHTKFCGVPDEFWKYQAKTRYCVFRLHYSTYKTNERDGQRFISCGYDYKKDGQIGGCGSPCDSIDEAIKFFNKGKERWC